MENELPADGVIHPRSLPPGKMDLPFNKGGYAGYTRKIEPCPQQHPHGPHNWTPTKPSQGKSTGLWFYVERPCLGIEDPSIKRLEKAIALGIRIEQLVLVRRQLQIAYPNKGGPYETALWNDTQVELKRCRDALVELG